MCYYDRQLEADRRDIENSRERARRESMTPFDDWGDNIDGYINNLLKKPSYQWVDGELKTIRGFKSMDIHFYDHLENTELSCYHKCRHRGYYDWMVTVKDRYLELRSQGKLKDIDVEKAEREEREYWVRYYDNNPQFKRPEGY
jgi:hypothetical protein